MAHQPTINTKIFLEWAELENLAKSKDINLSVGNSARFYLAPQKAFQKIIKIFQKNSWSCFLEVIKSDSNEKILGWDFLLLLRENEKIAIEIRAYKNCYELIIKNFEKHFEFHEQQYNDNRINIFLSKIINAADYPQFYP